MEKITKNEKFEKIKNLAYALNAVGYKASIWWNAEWYCSDYKIHRGIELMLIDKFDGEYGEPVSLIFSPDGDRIRHCIEAPIKKY